MLMAKFTDLASSASRLASATAVLAKKQAELTSLNKVSLPKIFYAVGRHVHQLPELPPELAPHKQRIDQLVSALGAMSEAADEDQPSGFAAKAKQVAQRASKATSDAAKNVQLQAAYVTCGKNAVERFGMQYVPESLQPDLTAAKQRVDTLNAEISELSTAHSTGLFSPQKLLLVGGGILGLLLALILLRSLGGMVFGRSRPAFDAQFVQDVMNSDEYKQIAKEASEAAARRTSEIKKTLTKVREDLASESRMRTRETAVLKFDSLLNSAISQWDEDSETLGSPLERDATAVKAKTSQENSLVSATLRRLQDQLKDAISQGRSDLVSKKDLLVAAAKKSETFTEEEAQSQLKSFKQAYDSVLGEIRMQRGVAISDYNKSLQKAQELRESLREQVAEAVRSQLKKWQEESQAAVEPLLKDPLLERVNRPKDQSLLISRAAERDKALAASVKGKTSNLSDIGKVVTQTSLSRLTQADLADSGAALKESVIKDFASKVSEAVQRIQEDRKEYLGQISTLAIDLVKQEQQEQMFLEDTRRRGVLVSPSLTDDELGRIVETAPDLTHLDLLDCKKLTDAAFKHLAKLKDLRWLRLPFDANLTPEAFCELSHLRLDSLFVPKNILDTPKSFGVFLQMHANLGDVRYRCRDGCAGRFDDADLKYGDEGLRHYEGLQIRGLELPIEGISDKGLRSLGKIKGLQELKIYLSDEMSDAGIAYLSNCRDLKELKIIDLQDSVSATRGSKEGRQVTPKAMRSLEPLELEDLDIPMWMQTEEALPGFLDALAEDAHKRRIIVFQNRLDTNYPHWPITEAAVKALAARRGVVQLTVNDSGQGPLVDGAIGGLWEAKDLQRVTFYQARVSGEGLDGVEQAKSLTKLSFIDPLVLEDRALVTMAKSPTLQEIYISGAPEVSDAGLKALSACKSLRSVLLRGTRATVSAGLGVENAINGCRVYIED